MTHGKPIHCWEYFFCTNAECPAYLDTRQACWLLENCQCYHHAGIEPEDRGLVCLNCPVFELSDDIESVRAFIRKRYSTMVAREHMAEQRIRGLSESFERITEAIEKLCLGDPSVVLEISSDNLLVRRLEAGINKLAETIAANVADSHEIAMGICEHYDALARIAAGDLSVTASEDSSSEIIAQLGVLINRCTSSLVSTIRQLKEADEQLSFTFQQMRDIIDFLPDAMFVIDQRGEIIAWNNAMETVTGKPKSEMLHQSNIASSLSIYGKVRPLLLNFLDRDLDEIRPYYSYVERIGDKLFAEAHVEAREGRPEFFLWVTAAPLIDQSGNRVGAVESIRDVTDFRKAEAARADLEHQLRQSQKIEAIGLLAGGVAHDFNNLLTAVIGYTTLIQGQLDPHSPLQGYLKQVAFCTDRATKLVQDLLTFGRKRLIQPQVLDVNDVIANLEGLLLKLLTEDIALVLHPEDAPLLVLIDKGMMEQVLVNLVANARDSMPAGGTVTIRTSREETPLPPAPGLKGHTDYAVVSVIDTGLGMEEELLDKIFEPFFTTKELGKGSGLGLSIVYGIVSQHGGTITVQSKLGQGSAFRLFLPLLDQEQAVLTGPEQAAQPPELVRGSETVLLVEDDVAARSVNEEVLRIAGYQVLTAENGQEAVLIYGREGSRIDLVVMDVIMPVMNGRDAYEAIRRIDPGVRCLFVSGYTADIIHQKGRIDTTFDFLAKPAPPHEFLRRVRTILDRR
ncbi:hybrid sensor histidine kinase/response regulator [Geomesophilobacter sediminis]|uniref:histidine kinase n=1 Tax=Geomesophilobacter sediminis TaxID=2798584 RepID=A0A8J7LZ31_9BACT|nr:ATP-binding protein [Geomesophilobacter sediminis]MBJ6725806.1 response regulator [Geomesophilobacter sediminis]